MDYVRVIVLLTVAAALQGTAFAQKKQDPDLRDKQAISVKSTKPHSAASPVRARSSSARDLAKIERNSIQKMKATHKAGSASAGAAPANAVAAQPKGKPVKFSYQPPKATGKTATHGPPIAASPSAKVRH